MVTASDLVFTGVMTGEFQRLMPTPANPVELQTPSGIVASR